MSKTYAEYVADSKKRKPSVHLMPPFAKPKYSRGDTQASRDRHTEMRRRGMITTDEIPVLKNGMIDKSKLRKIKREIYKAQETSHGR